MALLVKDAHDFVTLLASSIVTTDTSHTAVRLPGMVNGIVFTLDVTAAATAAGDLLDVYIQTKADGTNWLDVARFTQVLGNGGAKRYVMKIAAATACTGFETGTALGANAVRDILGDDWRVRSDITLADTPSFTFSVTACPM